VTARSSSFDALRSVLEPFAAVPAAEWRFLESHVSERTVARGEQLERAGRPVGGMYFVVDGLLRNYLLDTDGTERATGFRFPGDFAGDYSSGVVLQQPSTISIDALRASRVLVVRLSAFAQMYERHICWDRIGRGMSQRSDAQRQEKDHRFRRFTPEQHYHHLLVHMPHLATQVPLRHLASYLGIRPETLSRIRRRGASRLKSDELSPT